jgi:sugar phosphate isomerase/epimerase
MRTQKLSDPEARISRSVRLLGKRIVHVHIHDNHGDADEHLVPGEGSIKFGPIVDEIKKIGYEGFVIVELFEPTKAVESARIGLKRVREMFRQ